MAESIAHQHGSMDGSVKSVFDRLVRKALGYASTCLCYLLQDEVKGSVDVALLLKLQKQVAELEQEKMNLQREWDSREEQLQQEHEQVHIYWTWAERSDC